MLGLPLIRYLNVLPREWTVEQLENDLRVDGAIAGGGSLGNVRLGNFAEMPTEYIDTPLTPGDANGDYFFNHADIITAGGDLAVVVDGVDFVAGESFKQSICDHRTGTAQPFLRRLENEDDPAALVFVTRQMAGSPQQHRGVGIMAAGMHQAVIL